MQAGIVLVIVSLLVFIVVRLLPGDPMLMYMAREEITTFTPEQLEAKRAQFGLDKPILVQYIDWMGDTLRGDLGTSLFYREKVSKLLAERIPVTLHIGIIAFILSAFFGILAGTITALRRGQWLDATVTSLANLGMTVPGFWLGVIGIFVFGLYLKWLPIYGYTSPFENFWLNTRQLVMPVFCLSVHSIAGTTRQTRSAILEVTMQDYIRTAWSKGLLERVIVMRHILKNGLIPIITLQGMHLSHILGGSVLIETVFNIPGMGRLMVSSVFAYDYPVIQAGVLLSALMIVIANLAVDVSYGWFDPRVRFA